MALIKLCCAEQSPLLLFINTLRYPSPSLQVYEYFTALPEHLNFLITFIHGSISSPLTTRLALAYPILTSMSSALDASATVAAVSTSFHQTSNSSVHSVTAQPVIFDVITSLILPSSSTFATAPSSASPSLPTATAVAAPSSSTDNGPSLAMKVGVGAGAGILLLLILVGTSLILRHRKKHPSSSTLIDTSPVRAGVLGPRDSTFDPKHQFTLSQDAAALELVEKKESKRSLKGRRNSQLAQISEEPSSSPLSRVQEIGDRSRTISLLAPGPSGAQMSTGHISLIQSDDRISNIAQSSLHLSKIPPGDRLSLSQPGDQGSVTDIYALRQAALDILNGPNSPNDMESNLHSIDSRSGYTPSLPQRSPRRHIARSRELDVRSINSRHSAESTRRQRAPLTPETPPRSGSQSQVVDLNTGSSKYAP